MSPRERNRFQPKISRGYGPRREFQRRVAGRGRQGPRLFSLILNQSSTTTTGDYDRAGSVCPFVWLPLCTILIVAISHGLGPSRSCDLSVHSVYSSARGLGSLSVSPLGGEELREELNRKFKKGGPFSCLIAHSFGTYFRAVLCVICRGQLRPHGARRCVFGGRFPSEGLQESKPQRFHEVRNEMAARDNVARLAAWLDRLISDLARLATRVSGKRIVGARCRLRKHGLNGCDSPRTRAPIHNVRCEELGTVTFFLTRLRCGLLAALLLGI